MHRCKICRIGQIFFFKKSCHLKKLSMHSHRCINHMPGTHRATNKSLSIHDAVALEQEIPHLEPMHEKKCVNPCEPQVKNSNVESERSDGTGATGDTIGA